MYSANISRMGAVLYDKTTMTPLRVGCHRSVRSKFKHITVSDASLASGFIDCRTQAAADREKKLAAVLTALLNLASHSGVTQERSRFMSLVRTEMDRLHEQLVVEPGERLGQIHQNLSSDLTAVKHPSWYLRRSGCARELRRAALCHKGVRLPSTCNQIAANS